MSADSIVLDTTGLVQGVVGQTLKYHLMEACKPVLVVAMQRGAEMEPTIGMLQRFLGARVAKAGPLPELIPLGPVEKRAARIAAFAPRQVVHFRFRGRRPGGARHQLDADPAIADGLLPFQDGAPA